jgi:hypothetical protein
MTDQWNTYRLWREKYLKGETMNKDKIIENLVFLRKLITSYPEHLLDLARFRSERECGTLYCSVGLAASHPFFNAQGLHFGNDSNTIAMNGVSLWDIHNFNHADLDALFGENSFECLFQERGRGAFDAEHHDSTVIYDEDGYETTGIESSTTDKDLALWRIRRMLEIQREET